MNPGRILSQSSDDFESSIDLTRQSSDDFESSDDLTRVPLSMRMQASDPKIVKCDCPGNALRKQKYFLIIFTFAPHF